MEDVREGEPVGQNDPLRQGDVLVDMASADVAPGGYVIVTADCDLVHNKYGDRLAAVPFITHKRYVSEYWMPRVLATAADQLSSRLLDEMNRLLELGTSTLTPTPARLIEWPLEATASDIARALEVDPGELGAMTDLANVLRRLHDGGSRSLREQWSLHGEASVLLGMRSEERASASLAKRVARELPAQLPGDVLYLHRPVPDGRPGWIVLARFTTAIDPDLVARAPADEAYGQPRYRRVARLGSPYRYRLTQILGEVYSAIGLPGAYEEARADQFAELAASLDRRVG